MRELVGVGEVVVQLKVETRHRYWEKVEVGRPIPRSILGNWVGDWGVVGRDGSVKGPSARNIYGFGHCDTQYELD